MSTLPTQPPGWLGSALALPPEHCRRKVLWGLSSWDAFPGMGE